MQLSAYVMLCMSSFWSLKYICLTHGITLMEWMCCTRLLLQRFLTESNTLKSPIFWIGLVCWAMSTAVFVSLVDVGYILIKGNTATKSSEAPTDAEWKVYYDLTQTVALAVHTSELFCHIVMLIRLKTFGGWRTRSFISMLILAAIHGILCLPNAYYGFIINGTPSFFYHPLFPMWMLTNGILILITCIMNIAASFLFVHHLAQSLNVPFKKMVYNVLFKHEGCRWILLTLVHVFLVVGVVIAVLVDSTSQFVTLGYHFLPFGVILSLYLFLESSWVSAKRVVEGMRRTSVQTNMDFMKSQQRPSH